MQTTPIKPRQRKKHDLDRTPAHEFTAPADIEITADFRHRHTGAIHTWQVVKYRDFPTWKARNATTRTHRTAEGQQTTWGTNAGAIRDMDDYLSHFNFERLTPWAYLSAPGKVA